MANLNYEYPWNYPIMVMSNNCSGMGIQIYDMLIWKHNIIHTHSNVTWDWQYFVEYSLRQFCGGLASMFPNTTLVESDFSMVKWEKDAHCTGLTSLSLTGVMHSKQFDVLSGLF